MHLSAQATYDAGPDRVAVMFADPEFVRIKVLATGATAQTVDVAGTAAGAFTVTTRRQMPTTDVPPQFRALVGGNLEIREVQAWQAASGDTRHGTIVVEVTGAPVRLTGTMRMTSPRAGVTAMEISADLKASIPFFASAVEKAIADAMHSAIRAEEDAGAAWLSR
ncbi:DUF2505 domain-containing protein [Actinotalea sp.]|uniref:DUF2505 domain-containing protein n=1 Tax=Actinotalea sp. TaxID=1872145 RepID=UPI00356261FB